MPTPFKNSLFYRLISDQNLEDLVPIALLGGYSGSRFSNTEKLLDLPVTVFDFETTGLNLRRDRMIEIGAVKYLKKKEVARFSQLIQPGRSISKEITGITGITNEMLEGAPDISQVLPKFHDFLRGSVGVAHNAEFDMGMLYYESHRLGISCDYTIICSLKLARGLVKLDKYSLDFLAKHYRCTFGSRHRSIGDILVTAEVLWQLLKDNPHMETMGQFAPYREFNP